MWVRRLCVNQPVRRARIDSARDHTATPSSWRRDDGVETRHDNLIYALTAAKRQQLSETSEAKSFGASHEQARAMSFVGTLLKAPADIDNRSAILQ